MKYAIDILTRAEGSLEGDNLKGERRWERQAARALLSAERHVGSLRDAWGAPDTPRWDGVVGVDGRTLITQADPGNVRYRPGADKLVSNVFCGLTDDAVREIRLAVAEMGRERVFLSHSFQVHVSLRRLPLDLHDLIHWVPVPAVPNVRHDADHFTFKTLLWSARAIAFRLRDPLPSILVLLDWIRSCLAEDPTLKFEVMASEERMGQAEADAYVWGFEAFEHAFRSVRDQVIIHPSTAWLDVMRILERTKLVVSDPTAFGGPPIEAASFGIPVPATKCSLFHEITPEQAMWYLADAEYHEKPTKGFPELVVIGGFRYGGDDPHALVDVLDRWHRNADDYHRVGNACRRYVDETYTYASFVRRLDALIGQ